MSFSSKGFTRQKASTQSGFALVLVVTTTALLLILIVSFLGSSAKELHISKSDKDYADVHQWVQTSSGQVLGDLLSEIAAGSIIKGGSGGFYPATPLGSVPDRTTACDPTGSSQATPPNLLKQSRGQLPFYNGTLSFNGLSAFPRTTKYPPSQRSSSISTNTGGWETAIRSERWNTALLLPRKDPTSPSDYTPADRGETRLEGVPKAKWSWKPPDWIYLLSDAQTATGWNPGLNQRGPTPVSARYAFQMYDIGGLLDANVAGYDPDSAIVGGSVASRKGSIGFADLTQIGFTARELKALLQYRNASTLTEENKAPFGHRYANFLLNSQTNLHFLRAIGKTGSSTTNNRGFQSRAALLSYIQQLGANDYDKARLLGTLQYLTHFSRALEQPSFTPGFYDPNAPGSTPEKPFFVRPRIVPPAGKIEDRLYSIDTVNIPDLASTDFRRVLKLPYEMALGNNRGGNDAWGTFEERGVTPGDKRTLQEVINPALLDVRVTAPFQRQDGTQALLQEPLVKKRFPLERLSWITQRGPSALLAKSDPQYNPAGTEQAIYACFGLTWKVAQEGPQAIASHWRYFHGKLGGIFKLEDLKNLDKAAGGPREPDFFELLKAGIAVGSVGKTAMAGHSPGISWDASTFNQSRDRRTEFQILEIGANLIDQYDEDSFPTIIRLPNPDPAFTSDEARYNPPLFTANGIEDLPYFYRFHWRAIEDRNDAPNKPLPSPGGMQEITDNLNAFDGASFKCGTTVLMGFPELWNPHSANSQKRFDSENLPKKFRVVAASEPPSDLIDGGKMDPADVGLSTLPTLGTSEKPDSPSQWVSFVNTSKYQFTLKPIGFFAYANGNGNCLTLFDSSRLGTNDWEDSYPMTYHNSSQIWEWPLDEFETTPLMSSKASTLYWNDAPASENPGPPLEFDQRSKTYFLAAAPMWRITTTGGSLLTQPKPYPSWPSTAYTYKNKITTSASTSELPDKGKPEWLYLVSGNSYIWDGGTYSLYPYPLCPDISTVALSHGYTVRGSAPLSYTDGSPVPNPFPPYQTYLRALSDRKGVQRLLFKTNPSMTKVPGTPSPTQGGNAYKNRTVDLRGTELLFSVANNSLFREPTTLCQPGLPNGSSLTAGPDNFYTAAPYNGAVTDAAGTRWIGMSLGEVPSQFLLVTKLFYRDSYVGWVDDKNPAQGLKWKVSSDMPSIDIRVNKKGAEFKNNGSQTEADFYWLRTFQVPVTTVSLDTTFFTVRLQFEDPNGTWVTYDERFISVSGDGMGTHAASAVLGRSELEPVTPSNPQDDSGQVAWKDNKRPLSWGMPVVGSFDPRTPRFGQPTRLSNKLPVSVRGSDGKQLQMLNPTAFNQTALTPNGNNSTDRPTITFIDLPGKSKMPQVMNYHANAPASWNFNALTQGPTNGTKFPDSYLYASAQKAADSVGSAIWWASAKRDNELLFRRPSVNAFDYGWFSRTWDLPLSGGPTPVPSTYNKGLKTGISPEITLPNFGQSGNGGNYADSLRTGLFVENVAPSQATPADPSAPYRQAYADADDVVRRASGALASMGGYHTTMDGLPMAQASNFASLPTRPVLLNRPFRSVAEMGYAFRGEPWKQLSFSLPETGDAALLDLFCLSEPPPLSGTAASQPVSTPPVVAGKTSLNTRQEPVLRALLAGALKDEFNSSELLNSGTEAAKAAAALIDRTTGKKAWLGPLVNVSELAGKLVGRDMTGITAADPVYTATAYRTSTEPQRNPDIQDGKNTATWHFSGYSADLVNVFGNPRDLKNPRFRESALRALVDGGQTRVWNVMLDLIVQTGHLNRNATSLADFQKNAEAHVWVCLAIDRFTGEVLDRQLEWVND